MTGLMSHRSRWTIPALLARSPPRRAVLIMPLLGDAAGRSAARRRTSAPVVIAAGTAAVVAAGADAWPACGPRDGRAILLGTAFSTTTALLAVHGFATPGVIVGMNGVIALRRRPRSPSAPPCSR